VVRTREAICRALVSWYLRRLSRMQHPASWTLLSHSFERARSLLDDIMGREIVDNLKLASWYLRRLSQMQHPAFIDTFEDTALSQEGSSRMTS
jgi:hypothetical protein